MIFSAPDFSEHERVVFCCDGSVGLRAIIAIHDTTLGPAVGGARMLPYASETEALADVLPPPGRRRTAHAATRSYSENHLLTLTKKTLCGCTSNRSPTSRPKTNRPCPDTDCCRACCHTTNIVEPG